jgi:hypothetical protein
MTDTPNEPRETGPETIDKMVTGDNPTLDLYFDRHPDTMGPEDYVQMVRIMRRQRAERIAKKEK